MPLISLGRYISYNKVKVSINHERIFTFLEHWGIINYNLPQQSISTQGNYYQLNKNYWERFKVNFN